jgi:hypothetical protein
MEGKKRYYNSVEWGILKQDVGNLRSNGTSFLREMGFNASSNISFNHEQFYNELERIDLLFKTTKSTCIVIFDPYSPNIKRCSIPGKVTSLTQVLDFIKNNNLDLRNYKITIIERIIDVLEPFCGVVMTDGKGNTVIETLLDSSNLIDLTSAGVDTSKIRTYDFCDFEESHVVPYIINKIKMDCQHYRGYYEFIYGKYNGTSDIYYTYYSDNEEYLNIFKPSVLSLSPKRTNLY